MAQLIDIVFGGLTRVGPRSRVLDGVHISQGKGKFWGLSGPFKGIGSLCCGVCGKRII